MFFGESSSGPLHGGRQSKSSIKPVLWWMYENWLYAREVTVLYGNFGDSRPPSTSTLFGESKSIPLRAANTKFSKRQFAGCVPVNGLQQLAGLHTTSTWLLCD